MRLHVREVFWLTCERYRRGAEFDHSACEGFIPDTGVLIISLPFERGIPTEASKLQTLRSLIRSPRANTSALRIVSSLPPFHSLPARMDSLSAPV
jgi:hypothetical protein